MDDAVNERKVEHLRVIAEDPGADRERRYFDEVRLLHRALPELDLREIDPSTTFLGKRLEFPLLISSMTGGDHAITRRINCNLATAAQACGVAMGVGSQRVAFTHPPALDSFQVRAQAPDILLLANLGAVQLNYGFTVASCREAVDAIGADGLILHLNPLQEAVQPEGDTNFAGLAARIGGVVRDVGYPVIVKEVGAGISRVDADLLLAQGVRYLDVAGSGGTSWSRIESRRRPDVGFEPLGRLFQDWGIPTPQALRELNPLRERVTLIASGGIRDGVEMVKAMVLGASLCGTARPLLDAALESERAVVEVIGRLRREFVTAMFLLGVRTVEALVGNAALLAPTGAGGDRHHG
jgi:isopentenyl-diphosphate delta-isomerase